MDSAKRDQDFSRPVAGGITGILLAAGAGTRFEGQKCLARLANGVAIGLQSARNLAPAVDRLVCVVRPGDAAMTDLFQKDGFDVVENPDTDLGMSTSLHAGLQASGRTGGWLVALGDMPWIRPATCVAVANVLRESGGIVAPVFAGRRGHPAGFSARFESALYELAGDHGAREVFESHADAVRLIQSDDPGILEDVDTTTDLQCAS